MVGHANGSELMPQARRRTGEGPSLEEQGLTSGRALRTADAGQPAIALRFAGLEIVLDASGAAYIDSLRILAVSDLHLEKGSRAATRGNPLPPLDSHDTLVRLKGVIERYKPLRVLCLGDSFHDLGAGERMAQGDRDALAALCASAAEWIWIGGNHDPEVPGFCGGSLFPELRLGGIVFRHEPVRDAEEAQIAGHYHPKTSVSAGSYRFSGRCFSVSEQMIVMPAFGAYTGGLSCSDPVLAGLHRSAPQLFMLHASKIWRVA